MSRLLSFLLTSCTLIAPITPAWTQPKQDFRMEIEGKAADKPFELISMGPEGLALVQDLQEFSHGNQKWRVEMLDTTLRRFWTTDLDLDNRLNLVGFEHIPGTLYLLFRESQTTYYNFQLITMDLSRQQTQSDRIRFDLNFQLTHFTVAGTTALFGGYVNTEPAVLLYDHTSDHPKVLPGLFTKEVSLLDLRANHNGSFNVLLVENRKGASQRLTLRTFDGSGNLLVDDIIPFDTRYSVLSGMTSRLIHDDMMIAGTYGQGHSNDVLGFYSLMVDPFQEQAVRYTDLASIAHFLDYLPEKKAKKVLDKAARERADGRIPKYKANLLPIRLDESRGGYYLFAEMFHPPSNTTYYPYGSPSWNYNYYNNPFGTPGNPYRPAGYDAPYFNDVQRNSEVRMIQSVGLRFRTPTAAPGGTTLAYQDVKRPLLDQTGDFAIRNDSILLTYKYKSEIYYLTEAEDMSARPVTEKSSIRLMHPTDILKDEEDEGGLRFWYDRKFYAWGYRKVRATKGDESESRYVFYVNRLDY